MKATITEVGKYQKATITEVGGKYHLVIDGSFSGCFGRYIDAHDYLVKIRKPSYQHIVKRPPILMGS